jgi:hypothetical protein
MGKVRYQFLTTKPQISTHLKMVSQKMQWGRHTIAYITLRMEGKFHQTPEMIDMRDRVLQMFLNHSQSVTSLKSSEAVLLSDVKTVKPGWKPVAAGASFVSLRGEDGNYRLIVVTRIDDELQNHGTGRKFADHVNIHSHVRCTRPEEFDALQAWVDAAAPMVLL